jgi:hypothetical protein
VVSTDLSLTFGGLQARSVLELDVSAAGSFVAGEGSAIEVDGLGGAAVSGSWSFESQDEQGNTIPATGTITLRGAETLVFDLANDVDGCIPYSIDGADRGSLCGDAEPN